MAPACFYQSPIALRCCDAIRVKSKICIEGKNKCAHYNRETKNFEVNDEVLLHVNGKTYRLDEYHFHVPGEHKVNDRIYPAEIHYVFLEVHNHCHDHPVAPVQPIAPVHYDLCEGIYPNVNVLVIARVIENTRKTKDLTKLQVKVPSSFFEYDGTLTTGEALPVRWIVGDKPLCFNIEELIHVAKPSRDLQDLDGRMVLHSC
jgi:carbonic anhydrase